MSVNTSSHQDSFSNWERELAAAIRQYRRAVEADDHPAKELEADAISERIRRLLYAHLELRVDMSSDGWFWLDGREDCQIEQTEAIAFRASGRVDCSLPDGRRQWTEPFVATISSGLEVNDYTIYLGNHETLLHLAKVRQLIESGQVPYPPAPANQRDWAFVFHKGDRGNEGKR